MNTDEHGYGSMARPSVFICVHLWFLLFLAS